MFLFFVVLYKLCHVFLVWDNLSTRTHDSVAPPVSPDFRSTTRLTTAQRALQWSAQDQTYSLPSINIIREARRSPRRLMIAARTRAHPSLQTPGPRSNWTCQHCFAICTPFYSSNRPVPTAHYRVVVIIASGSVGHVVLQFWRCRGVCRSSDVHGQVPAIEAYSAVKVE